MRTWTETRREGTYLGPVEWDESKWPFAITDRQREWLKRVSANPNRFRVTTYGGVPRCGIHRVLEVGMYDGWPYWRPGPAVLVAGPLGSEWHFANAWTDIYEDDAEKGSETDGDE